MSEQGKVEYKCFKCGHTSYKDEMGATSSKECPKCGGKNITEEKESNLPMIARRTTMSEQEQEKKTLEFPLTNDRCPTCQCQERLGDSAINQLKEAGKVPKDSFPDGLVITVALIDPTRPPVIIATTWDMPVLLVHFDVCAECMTIYCTKFNLQFQPMQVGMQQAR